MFKHHCGCAAVLFAACALLGSCAARRFDTSRVDPALAPTTAASDPSAAMGARVQWGGVVIQTHNLKDATEVEVLAYPLWRSGLPRTDRAPLGRFLARSFDYWDPAEYSPGRLLTVVGPVDGTRKGRVGESEVTYPEVAVEQSYLWPLGESPPEPRVHFGIGVIFH